MGYVKDKDVKAATVLPEVGSDEEEVLSDDWVLSRCYIVFSILESDFNVNPCFDTIQVLKPMGYTQPLTRTY